MKRAKISAILGEERLLDRVASPLGVMASSLVAVRCCSTPDALDQTEQASSFYLTELRPILGRYGVAAYLSGHDHDMEHIQDKEYDGLNYIVSGAGSKVTKGPCVRPRARSRSRSSFGMGCPHVFSPPSRRPSPAV